METTVVKGGKFTFTMSAAELARGLRTTNRMARNSEFLATCEGALGKDGVLSVIEEITRLATTEVTDGFPFPQIFALTDVIIVCGLKKIYEYVAGSLVLKYTATTPGSTWCLIDSFEYVYLSNGAESVVRAAGDKSYTLNASLPTAQAMCMFGGQAMIGAPDVSGLGANLVLPAEAMIVTASITGSEDIGE